MSHISRWNFDVGLEFEFDLQLLERYRDVRFQLVNFTAVTAETRPTRDFVNVADKKDSGNRQWKICGGCQWQRFETLSRLARTRSSRQGFILTTWNFRGIFVNTAVICFECRFPVLHIYTRWYIINVTSSIRVETILEVSKVQTDMR